MNPVLIATSFYARGKLLISGEYLVLDGCQALAVPCRFGQHMKVKSNRSPELRWKSLDMDGVEWFSGRFNLIDFSPEKPSDEVTAEELRKLLHACGGLNPDFLSKWKGFAVETKLEFDRNWGLGSSSTLMYCLAAWAEVDPFDLQFRTFGGSGYDIACADAEGPIVYQNMPTYIEYDPVIFRPSFLDQLFFVHLGQKQNSRKAVEKYQAAGKKVKPAIKACNELTKGMTEAGDLDSFMAIMNDHETLIAEVIDEEKVQDRLFPEFEGSVKSLGAWGGDFVLAASAMDAKDIRSYFQQKGYDTILSWKEMVHDERD